MILLRISDCRMPRDDAIYLRSCVLDYASRKYGPDYGLAALELERHSLERLALNADGGPEEELHRRVRVAHSMLTPVWLSSKSEDTFDFLNGDQAFQLLGQQLVSIRNRTGRALSGLQSLLFWIASSSGF